MDIRVILESKFPVLKEIKETKHYVDGFSISYETMKYENKTFYSHTYNKELTCKRGTSSGFLSQLPTDTDDLMFKAIDNKVDDYKKQLSFDDGLRDILSDTHRCMLEKVSLNIRDFFQTIINISKTYNEECKLMISMNQKTYDMIAKEFFSDMHFDEFLIINSNINDSIVEIININEIFFHIKTKDYQATQTQDPQSMSGVVTISRYEQIDCIPDSTFWQIQLV